MATAHVNPIVPGFSPDPSICRVGDTFYLATSSFHFFPGIPVYASKDLVEWKLIGNAINRKTQLSVADTAVRVCPQHDGPDLLAIGGIHAPTIRFKDDIFYIVCTNVTHVDDSLASLRFNNFVITTKEIWSNEWSDPVPIELHGFDPNIFFDDDGKVYIQGAEEPGPDLKIIQYEVDIETGRRLSEKHTIWTGVSKYYPEGPHIYKKDGWYYLLVAEGGTHSDHSVNIARARDIWGPYISFENNPILTARDSSEYIQHVGHADLVDDTAGNWWAVCLGVRRTGEQYVLGRETFLTPCSWPEGEWPSLSTVKLDLEAGVNLPVPGAAKLPASSPAAELLFIRDTDEAGFKIEKDGELLTVIPQPIDLSSLNGNIAFTGIRQRKLKGVSSVKMNKAAGGETTDLKAGLAYYKDEVRYARIYYDYSISAVVTDVVNTALHINTTWTDKTAIGDGFEFRVTYTEELYQFAFRPLGSDNGWTAAGQVDSLHMTAFDFTGPVIGVFALGASKAPVQFMDLYVE